MGYMSLMCSCGMCDKTFMANPERVPCFPCNRNKPLGLTRLSPTGSKEPVCEDCFNAVNAYRVKNGLPAHALPSGAYDAQEVS